MMHPQKTQSIDDKYKHLEALFRHIADVMPDMVWGKDLERKFIFVNKAVCDGLLCARDTDEPIGMTDMFFVERERKSHPDNPLWHTFGEICIDSDSVVLASGKTERFYEFGNVRGKFLALEVIKTPLRDDTGKIIGTVGAGRDITERKQMEEALQESLLLGREAEKIARIGAWKVNPKTDYLYWTEGVYEIVEAPPDYKPGMEEAMRLFTDESIPVIREALHRALEDGTPFVVEVGLTTMKGRHIWTEVCGLARIDNGEQAYVLGTFQDITARKLAEETMRESEARFRNLLEDVPSVAIQGYGPDGTTRYWNRASERLYGYSAKEAIGRNLVDLIIPPEMREGVEQVIREMAVTGQAIPSSELSLMRKDGSRVTVYSSHVIIKIPGRPQELFCIDIDLSERKKAEEQSMRLVTVIEQAAESIAITDIDGIIQYVNPAFERTSGYTHIEAIGKNPRILKSGKQNAEFYKQMWAVLSCGDVWTGRFVNLRKDGTLYEEDATISPIRNPAGNIAGYAVIKRDVSKELRLEAQFRQAQKMEAVGQLAGGVAHDFNNLLQAILGYCEIILNQTSPVDPRHGDLVEIQRTGQRATELTRHLLAFSRRQNLDRRVSDINFLIDDLNKMLCRVLGENIHIDFDFSPNLDRVLVDPGQIGQVLLNLSVNARDAMPCGGRLTFKTAMRSFSEGDLLAHPEIRAGSFVCVSITDNGTGMSQEVLDELFQPFFTTKEPGKGTGLGLATSYGIISQHGGWIEVYSEVGLGSTFHIYLPVLERETTPAAFTAETNIPSLKSLQGSGELILFVEDESMIRALVKRQCELNGYKVITAADISEASAKFDAASGAFDVVISDVVLPDGNGLDLIDKLIAKNPRLRILISSGYTDNEKRWPIILDRKWRFIGKPYSTPELLGALREILAKAISP